MIFHFANFKFITALVALKRERLWFAYALLAIFLFSQTAALIHTEIHPFHEHSEQCEQFAGVEHQSLALSTAIAAVHISFPNLILASHLFLTVVASPYKAFHPRAPPFLTI